MVLMTIRISNAIIESVSIGYVKEDGFCCTIAMGYGAGRRYMRIPFVSTSADLLYDYVGFVISSIIRTVGVKCWEDLHGKAVRIKSDENCIYEIGNFLADDRWFNPKKEIEEKIRARISTCNRIEITEEEK